MNLHTTRRDLFRVGTQGALTAAVSKQADLKRVCRLNNARQVVVDVQAGEARSGNRIIHYLGDDEFFPAGVPSVRLRFALEKEKANAVTIRGSVPEVTLQRTGG